MVDVGGGRGSQPQACRGRKYKWQQAFLFAIAHMMFVVVCSLLMTNPTGLLQPPFFSAMFRD